ncbi:ATP-dependent DNA helicase PIF7-like [Papaver somniferum]|uniref:ATP-dependent DNA helicase PIF7-like n=1 Tax=Papaver somniferum TaxID=3469 RepID=UPI000E6FFBCE|nr:ATP-dependent DNA helicase PIF7-like [Papaver somniferum]XP_026460493.1 ATP-dependent DNA helicase PIF7-like [Papaver somniferum]
MRSFYIAFNWWKDDASTFHIPFEPQFDSKCNVNTESEDTKLFRDATLIIWDEVAMQHRFCIEAVDRTLRDVRKSDEPFGGIIFVLGGDFKQTLPIVQRGRKKQIIDASIKSFVLWRDMNVFKLTQNMRLESQDLDNIAFAEYLLKVGENTNPKINLPSTMSKCVDLHELISKIYPGIKEMSMPTPEYFTERTILSPRNDEVSEINKIVLEMYNGESHTFLAADKQEQVNGESSTGTTYTSETLNQQNPSGLPPFKLDLKVGCPIMLLRNLAPRSGLCNGTRLRVEICEQHVIMATILT